VLAERSCWNAPAAPAAGAGGAATEPAEAVEGVEYLVKWKDLDHAAATWEKAEVGDSRCVNVFL
jgi:hypothetical protein